MSGMHVIFTLGYLYSKVFYGNLSRHGDRPLTMCFEPT